MKKCSKCRISYPATTEYFYKQKDRKYGLTSTCKSCLIERSKIWAKSAKGKASAKRYRQSPERRVSQKNRDLQKSYGITLEQYDKMFSRQNGLCAICGKPETIKLYPGVKPRLSVDHNHKTGKVRGLLCNQCNMAIGNFKEDTHSMIKAILYLEN